MPLPRDETTPPVMKMYLVIESGSGCERCGGASKRSGTCGPQPDEADYSTGMGAGRHGWGGVENTGELNLAVVVIRKLP